jgi:hypothetical protein
MSGAEAAELILFESRRRARRMTGRRFLPPAPPSQAGTFVGAIPAGMLNG